MKKTPILVACALLGACEQQPASSGAVQQAQVVSASGTPADQVYSTRGEVSSLVVAGSPASEFRITHEAIDSFVNKRGDTVGMSSHAMTFPYVAPGVDVDALQIGDKVGFTFEVRWNEDPRWVITELSVLAPDTPLEYRKASPPQNDDDGAN